MFEVGKKYVYRDNLNMVVEVLHTTDKNALVRMIEHPSTSSIGNEYLYDHSLFCCWKEYKEPRTITRWVNVYEVDGELSMGPIWPSREKAIYSGGHVMGYKDTVPISYTEPR